MPRLPFPGCFPPPGIVTNPALPRKDSPFEHSIPFRGSVRISACSEQREMGHEGRRGGGGQGQGTSSLVKKPNRRRTHPFLPKLQSFAFCGQRAELVIQCRHPPVAFW